MTTQKDIAALIIDLERVAHAYASNTQAGQLAARFVREATEALADHTSRPGLMCESCGNEYPAERHTTYICRRCRGVSMTPAYPPSRPADDVVAVTKPTAFQFNSERCQSVYRDKIRARAKITKARDAHARVLRNLTTTQKAMVARLRASTGGERTPFTGGRGAGAAASGWYRTAASLKALGLIDLVREGDGERATLKADGGAR